jgi:hypothetical protein
MGRTLAKAGENTPAQNDAAPAKGQGCNIVTIEKSYDSASAVTLDFAIAFLTFNALTDSSVSFAFAMNLSKPPR